MLLPLLDADPDLRHRGRRSRLGRERPPRCHREDRIRGGARPFTSSAFARHDCHVDAAEMPVSPGGSAETDVSAGLTVTWGKASSAPSPPRFSARPPSVFPRRHSSTCWHRFGRATLAPSRHGRKFAATSILRIWTLAAFGQVDRTHLESCAEGPPRRQPSQLPRQGRRIRNTRRSEAPGARGRRG